MSKAHYAQSIALHPIDDRKRESRKRETPNVVIEGLANVRCVAKQLDHSARFNQKLAT
jgi:hypothetical protein